MTTSSVVIVGGGISGLSAAWELTGGAQGPSENTPRIEVIEASDRLGGALATADFAGHVIDLGADGFLARRPEAVTLVRELGWDDHLEAIGAQGAWLYLRGGLHALPPGLVLGVPTSARQVRQMSGLSWRATLAAYRDQVWPRKLAVTDATTIGDIVRGKLGRELAYQFVEPMIGGIQAGRIDELSALMVFPALLDAARQGGSLMKAIRPKGPVNPGPQAATSEGPAFYTLTSGVGSLTEELVRQLRERGVIFRLSTAVTALRRTPSSSYPLNVDCDDTTTPANAVILATPAPNAGRLLEHTSAFDALRAVRSAGAAMVSVQLDDTTTLPESGTGVLVPLATPRPHGDDSFMITALTFLDRKWAHLQRPGQHLVRAHVGRIDDTRWRDLSDDALVKRVIEELSHLLPTRGHVLATRVQRWPQGLPQYDAGHELVVANARREAKALDVWLCGNAYDGVGIPASIGSGRRAALEVLAALA